MTFKTLKILALTAALAAPLGACASFDFQEAGYEILQGHFYSECQKKPFNHCVEPVSFKEYQDRTHPSYEY